MKIKTIILFLLIAGSAAGSWYYHRQVYILYNQAWYKYVRGSGEQGVVDEAEQALERGDYDSLRVMVPRFLLVYPENERINLVAARYFRDRHKPQKAAYYASRAMQNRSLPLPVVQELLSIMFSSGLYGDIVGQLDSLSEKNSAWREDPDLSWYYGVSCYRLGDLYAAHLYLARSALIPGVRPDVYFELSKVTLELAKKAPDESTRSELLRESRQAIDQVLDRNGFGGVYGMQAAKVYRELGLSAEADMLAGKSLP